MDPIRARTVSRVIRWCSAFILIVLIWSHGLPPEAYGADSTRQRSSGSSDDAWVQADPDLAYRYITVGWVDWAALEFQEIALEQVDVESWIMTGLTLQSLGDEVGALNAYEQGARLALGDDRAESAALTLLGQLHLKRGHLGQARGAFDRALELSPQNAQALYGLGRLSEQSGSSGEAIEWYQRAAEASREWIEPVVAAAALLNDEKEFGRAVALLKDASRLGTSHAEYHFQLARGYEGLLLAIVENGLQDDDLEALLPLGIVPDRARAMLKERALHAVDRLKQLQGDHPGADRLLSHLNHI